MAAGLSVTLSSLDGVVHVVAVGDIDVASEDGFERALLEAVAQSGNAVSIDLAGVPFMGSAGISVLIRVRRVAQERGITLRIARASHQVERLINLMGLFDDLRDGSVP
jgi:anti-anti-sigma factor